MILFRTLLNRDMWMNPLSDVFGNWWIWKYAEDGSRQLTTECIENLMLFIPFTVLFFWTVRDKVTEKMTFAVLYGRDLRSHFCFLCPLNFCSCSCVLELFSFQICFTILWVEALEA